MPPSHVFPFLDNKLPVSRCQTWVYTDWRKPTVIRKNDWFIDCEKTIFLLLDYFLPSSKRPVIYINFTFSSFSTPNVEWLYINYIFHTTAALTLLLPSNLCCTVVVFAYFSFLCCCGIEFKRVTIFQNACRISVSICIVTRVFSCDYGICHGNFHIQKIIPTGFILWHDWHYCEHIYEL